MYIICTLYCQAGLAHVGVALTSFFYLLTDCKEMDQNIKNMPATIC